MPAPTWISLSEHKVSLSRHAFAACDSNADDRLSVIEAARTLEGITSDNLDAFRRIDRNSDGYVHWPEFDERFRELTERGTPMRIRPFRPLPTPKLEPRTATPVLAPVERAAALIAQFDTDRDGNLSMDEVAATLKNLGAPADLLVAMTALDLDRSQDLSPAELLPMVAQLPATAVKPKPTPRRSANGLPPGFARADANEDGVLDRREFEEVLRSIDSILPRWSQQIIRAADRSGNNTLGPHEIRRASANRGR